MKETYSGQEPIRINKWLASIGYCSRRKAEELINDKYVKIDDVLVCDLGRKIQNGETIQIDDGAQLKLSQQLTLIYNKPIGIVSGHAQKDEIPAIRMIKNENFIGVNCPKIANDISIPPIGRLDKDSHGLLILSQDGVLAKSIIAPDSGIEKEYIIKVEGIINDEKLKKLRHGLSLDGRKLKPAKVFELGNNQLRFILKEGRNRQIRRMCKMVGLLVIDLIRIRIGEIALGNLGENQWRIMTETEKQSLILNS